MIAHVLCLSLSDSVGLRYQWRCGTCGECASCKQVKRKVMKKLSFLVITSLTLYPI